MAKIIRIKENLVSIGNEDGTFFDVERNELDFDPVVGDSVEVYSSGNRVMVSKVNKVSTSVVGSASSEPPKSDNTVYTEGHVVNQLAYALFAIFLGGLGVHKFYAGRIGKGILYLLFCWTFIPGLIGLIEGIIAITKKADSNGNIVV